MAGDSSSDGDHKKHKLSKPKSLKKKHSKGKYSSSSSDDDHKKHKLTKPKSAKKKHSKGKHSSGSSSDDDGKKEKLAKVESSEDEHSHDKHSSDSSSDDDGHKQKLAKEKSLKEEHSHDKHSGSSSSDEDGHKHKLKKPKSSKDSSSSSDEDGHKLKLTKEKSLKEEHSHDKHSSSSSSDEDGSKHKLKKLKSSKEEHSYDHDEEEYEVVSKNTAHDQIVEMLTVYGASADESRKERFAEMLTIYGEYGEERYKEQIAEMLTMYGASAEERHRNQIVRMLTIYFANTVVSHRERIVKMLTIYASSTEEIHREQIYEMVTIYGVSTVESHKEQIVRMLTIYGACTEKSYRVQIVVMLRIYFASREESHREQIIRMLTIYGASSEESHRERIFRMLTIYGACTEESHRELIVRMLTIYGASSEESHREQIFEMLKIYGACTEERHREQIFRMLTIYVSSTEESHREQIFGMLKIYGASTEETYREQILYMLTIYGASTEESYREHIFRMLTMYGASTEESHREQIFKILTIYGASREESHREQIFRMLTMYGASREESHREQIVHMLTIYGACREESEREQIFRMLTIYGACTEESHREQIFRMLKIYGSSTEESDREQIVRMLTIYGACTEESHREQIVYMLTIYGACTEESHREQIFRMLTIYGACREESQREQIFRMLTIYGASTEESHREQIFEMLTIYGSSRDESQREQIFRMLTIYGASREESHRVQIIRMLTIYSTCTEVSHREQIAKMLTIYGASTEESHREQIFETLTIYGACTEERHREQIFRMLTIYGACTEERHREQVFRMLTIYGTSTEESHREQIVYMLTIYGACREESHREQIFRMLKIYGSSSEESHREQIVRMLTIYGACTEESHKEQIFRMLTIYGASREESHRKQIVHMLTIYGACREESQREQIFRMLTIYGACTEESHREQIFRMVTIYGASTEESHREQIFEMLTIYGACKEESHRRQVVKMLTIYGASSEESRRERIAEMLTTYATAEDESHREKIVDVLASYGAAEEESNNEQFAFEERVEVLEQAKGIRDESEEGGGGAFFEEESSSGGHETEGYHIAVSETISTPEPELNVESSESEDDDGGIQETGDAESETSASIAVDVTDEDEEALFEIRETSDAVSQEDENYAESADTEVVAESESAFGEEALVEERETSDVEEEKHLESRSSVSMETEQVQLNLKSLHEPVFTNAREIEGKSEHDDGCFEVEDEKEAGSDDLIMEVSQNKLLMPILTPSSASSPAKRSSSVYKIVMSLEGSQVGEKCIHGEIDHGLCHHRHSNKKPSSPGSYSPSARVDWSRDSSVSPKVAVRDAAPLPEVRTSSGESREVDNEWSFVQHDSTSGTQVLSGTTRTETYTDTLLIRKDDGYLLRTPGPSPLSEESMRTVVSQVEGSSSGSDTTKLKIVHEFSAEQEDIASEVTAAVDGESEVEKILRLQETHDLVCPVCRSCITKRVILRKRKRTSVVSSVETWDSQRVVDEEDSFRGHVDVANAGEQQTVVEEYENYGCLNCFSVLFCLERSAPRTKAAEVPQAPEEAPGTPVAAPLPEPVAALPPSPIAKDYNNRCLPVFFTWRRKTTISTDSDIVAPLLSEGEREQDSSVVQTITQDIYSKDVLQHTSTKRKEISASEIQETSSFGTQHPDSGTLTLPAAPGVAEGVQIPVVVVESKEDRLCFPFLRTRGTRTTQVHPELTEPLLTKEEVQPKSPKSPKSDEVEQQQALKAEDFDRIDDQWWMRRQVSLEVPVSEPPREEEEVRTPEPASDTPSVATSRVTEEERRVNCLCFPSWVSTETTVVDTERASVSEATEELQASTSTIATEGSEVTSSSLSFQDAVVLPVTSEGDVQTASLNCIEILVPSYPWGPPGVGRMQEVIEERRESAADALPPFRFIRVAYREKQGTLVLPVAESPEVPALQPNQSVVVTQAVERREDSTCFPLSLPALSWRRVELISGETADGSSETSTTVIKTTETKAPEPALLQEKPVEAEFSFGDIETSRNQQEQTFNDDANELVEEEEEEEPLVRKSPAPKKPEAEPLPLPEPEPVVVHESVTVVSEETDETGGSLSEIIEKDLSFSPELTTAEVVIPATPVLPVVGGDEVKEKESVNCCLPLYYRPSYQPIEVAESVTTIQTATAASETLPESSVSHIFDAVGTSETVTEEENRDTGSFNCCLPSYKQLAYQPPDVPVSDALVEDSASGFKTVHEEVTKETTIDARIKTEEKTTSFVTDEEHAESIESVRVDTTVSYVHGEVQHDNGDAEGTLYLDDHPTLSFHPVAMDFKPAPQQPAYVTGPAALSRFVEEDDETEVEVKESLAELPSQEVGKTEEEVQITEATEHDIGEVISVEQGGRQDDEEDGACCVPRSKWLWGRWNYTTSEAQLREPLLEVQPEPAHVEVQQKHEVTVTTIGGDDTRVAVEEERCRCFPWTREGVTETVATTVTVRTDSDTVIEVDGTDATSTLAAASAAAEDAGMVMDEPPVKGEYLKSIVYGGLDVSLTSLGVVAAAAGGDAKMRNILALGLSNLIFGFLTFFYRILELHNEGPARFHESVGARFWINGPLAMLSFLLFGALPVLTFVLSFRHLNDHGFKMAATAFASLIAVVFLGCGKVAAKMTELSYKRTVSGLIMTGIVASVSAFYAGEYISKLLAQAGIFDE